jgi:hypothetical protein
MFQNTNKCARSTPLTLERQAQGWKIGVNVELAVSDWGMHNRDRRRVGVRIEHFEIGMRHDPQHLVRRTRATYRCEKGQQQKCCPQAADRHSIPFTRKPARILRPPRAAAIGKVIKCIAY